MDIYLYTLYSFPIETSLVSVLRYEKNIVWVTSWLTWAMLRMSYSDHFLSARPLICSNDFSEAQEPILLLLHMEPT